jgi:hypothetical protein
MALAMRLVQIALCASLELERSGVALGVEAGLCLLTWLWCWIGSRMPTVADYGIPARAAHGGPCGRLPRFTTFALVTAMCELYSTAATAWAVAGAPCGNSVLQLALPYCIGVAAVAARVYSALLALRVQDEFNGATARVMPAAAVDMDDIEFDLGAVACGPGPRKAGDSQGCGWQEPTKPAPSPKAVNAESAARGAFDCLRCQVCGWSSRTACLMRLVLLAVVVVAVASVWMARAMGSGEAPAEKPPSSCAPAQNGTSTCVPFEYVGRKLWDQATGRSHADMADTMEDCCAGCDGIEECQAWIFEGPAKRCRWIRFQEEPCLGNPGDLNCRCITHFGMTFGFKPTSQIIWVKADST